MAPKQTDPQFKLRMTQEIKDAVERAAAANNRSMNAEILARLQQSIDVDGRWPNLPPAVVEMLRRQQMTEAHRTSLDKIATAAIKKLTTKPGLLDSEELERITSKYEELKQREVRGVREFMETVHSLMEELPDDDEEDENAPISGQDIVPMKTILSKNRDKP